MSALDWKFQKFEEDVIKAEIFQVTPAWDEKTKTSKYDRVSRAKLDFWYFDKTYFPAKSHRQGYSKPGRLHRTIFEKSTDPGIKWFATHRGLAKTAYLLKIRTWQLLFGHSNILVGGFLSKTLTKSRLLKDGIEYFINENPRIRQDFNTNILISNNEMLAFSCDSNPHGKCRVIPFSLENSPRGAPINGSRLDFLDFDDLETLESSFSVESVEKRIELVLEGYKSTALQNGSICLSNNLHPSCGFNRLWKLEQKGEKRELFELFPCPDWSDDKKLYGYKGSVWKEAFPAKSEEEMKLLRGINDEHEWSQAQCKPQLRSGRLFPAEFYKEYKPDDLPADAIGVAYADQNNSLKGLGDTTAMGALLYSRMTDKFYVYKPVCRSYSNPNTLLSDFFGMYDQRILAFGMDGHVNQESNWTAHINNWRIKHNKPSLYVRFKNYNVDNHIEMFRLPYMSNDVLFPEGFGDTEDGKRFKEQLFGFAGKKANKKDDAPDFLICAYTLGMELNYYRAVSGSLGDLYKVGSIAEDFSF